ncbi:MULTISPECIES: 2-dehydro-3-deoxygalactonokinase [unclassified Clostridium]|uniref:2-dehydro-3-deoxygalactonokinase n=1 Tax=unclassified Clostridium TaxID=2614128 RepID=UPI001107328A|nr:MULTISPECIES: 2-dehydro-3-deoxygalactonokinase [unclassified Clostridium]
MEKFLIAIDAGTTNTRAALLDQEGKLIGLQKAAVGVRNTAIDGDNHKLREAVKGCIKALLTNRGLLMADLGGIVASGMITSNVGLVEVPHICAPADAKTLAENVRAITLPEVCDCPIWFIPGIKSAQGPIGLDNFEDMDIMRGEEVESVAVIAQLHRGDPMLLVLPGSHTKFVAVDRARQITGSLTTIAGELLSAITQDTILADAVGRQFVAPGDYDPELMAAGYKEAEKYGLGRAAFLGRILNQFTIKDKTKIANYILGTVVQGDVRAAEQWLKGRGTGHTVVCGTGTMSRALADALAMDGEFGEVAMFDGDGELPLSTMGALEILRQGNYI